MVTKDKILNEIKRIVSERGLPPGYQRFQSDTGIREHEWGRFWARWGDALAEAGFPPNRWQEPVPEEELFEQLAKLTRELGHFPTTREVKVKSTRDPSFHSHTTFRRFGGQRKLAESLQAYAMKKGYRDVAALCGEAGESPDPTIAETADSKLPTGFVYLMKSGRHFKIGRTISVGSRERQLTVTIPIPPTTIHRIETDDPVGVEAYWHKRFETKRGQGEWFNLSPEDIKAFKRWRRLV